MRSIRAVAVVVLALAVAAGCDDGSPSASPASPAGATSAPASSPSPASLTPAATTVPPGESLEPTRHEPALIDLLPGAVDGRSGNQDFQTGAEMATDPGLQATVAGVALAVYADDESYAIASVSRIRPGIFGDAFYRDWRDTFDEAVCEQAGGVDVGHSEVEIDGRLAFRSACVGGVVIYHLHLDDPDTIISLQGAGPVDLGAMVLDDLRLDMR